MCVPCRKVKVNSLDLDVCLCAFMFDIIELCLLSVCTELEWQKKEQSQVAIKSFSRCKLPSFYIFRQILHKSIPL